MRFGSRSVDSLVSAAARRHPPGRRVRELAKLGSPEAVVLESLALAIALRKQRSAALALAAAAPLAIASGRVVKRLAHRPRPGISRFERKGHQSFPSTHTAGSFALLACLYEVAPRTRRWRAGLALGAAAAIAIAIERIEAERHWLTDVVAGVLWGALVGSVIGRLSKAASRRGAVAGNAPGPAP